MTTTTTTDLLLARNTSVGPGNAVGGEARVTDLLTALSIHVVDQVAAPMSASPRHSTSDAKALIAIACVLPGLSQDTLAGLLELPPSAATRLVDRLVSKDLVWRDAGPEHRAVPLRATLRGQQAAAEVVQSCHKTATQVLAALDPAEQRQLAVLLQKLLVGATRSRADAGELRTYQEPPYSIIRPTPEPG